MLKPDEAAKQLETWMVKDAERAVKTGIEKLPAKLRPIAQGVLGIKPKSEVRIPYYGWKHKDEFTQQQMQALDALNKRDRRKLFDTLCGPLAASVELTWEHLKTAPYQTGWYRRSFRAPNTPSASLEPRFEELQHLSAICIRLQDDVLSPEWLAAWCPHIGSVPSTVPHLAYMWMRGAENATGRLFAAVIDAGGKDADAVFEVLRQSANNEHEIGAMGRHVPRALLSASREDGWELMERMLLAAQRQEGLRQAILETVDEAHPEAFRRVLRVIVDHKLARFSAVVRAVNVWLGMQWDSASVKTINDTCEVVLEQLANAKERKASLVGDDPIQVFHALWALAFEDVEASVKAAAKAARHGSAEVRFVAAYHLGCTDFAAAQPLLISQLGDADLRVAVHALLGIINLQQAGSLDVRHEVNLFAALEQLFLRCPTKPKKLEPLVWPWTQCEIDRATVAGAMIAGIDKLPPSRLVPYIHQFDPSSRRLACDFLRSQKKWDNETRETLLKLIGDSSQSVRHSAFKAFRKSKTKLKSAEAVLLEGLLTRKSSDLRQGIVEVLLGQSDRDALASGGRLTAAGQANQRLAGLEVIKELAEADRLRDESIAMAQEYHVSRKRLSKDEQTQLDAILAAGADKVTLDNGLGLFDRAERTPRFTPQKRKVQAVTSVTFKLLQDLDKLVHQHRKDPVKLAFWDEEREELLGALDYGFPSPDGDRPAREQLDSLPLRDIWLDWERSRPKTLRDADGCELLRACHYVAMTDGWEWEHNAKWLGRSPRRALKKLLVGDKPTPKFKYRSIVAAVLGWLFELDPPRNWIDLSHDITETVWAQIPEQDLNRLKKKRASGESNSWLQRDSSEDWRERDIYEWLVALEHVGDRFSKSQIERHWKLWHWLDEPVDGAERSRPAFATVASAYATGVAAMADLMDQLIGPENFFSDLDTLTQPRLEREHARLLEQHPEVATKLEEIRERVLELELARGDLPTPATEVAAAINTFYGIETLVRVLTTIGKERFRPTLWRQNSSRTESLTDLARCCHPASTDSPDDFKRQVKAAVKTDAFSEERVLQLAFLAPQWTQFIQHYYGWDGLDEGLYWFLAHMHYVSGSDEAATAAGQQHDPEDPETDDEYRQRLTAWERLVLERTPLSALQRSNGAIDVDWFHRTFNRLGSKRWLQLAAAARFAATPAQAKRAQHIADVLLGNVQKQELVEAIQDRKLKEQVRLLGLLPLAKGARRAKDLQDRYAVLQEYKRYAKTLSSMSKPDAMLAVDIGLQNLAQLAGYRDPLRLEWAMEAEATADLLKGPIAVSKGDVSMTLSLDERSQPQVTIRRGEKPLKSLPAAVKKEKSFAELAERNRELKRQASRVRESLEAAMCRGDEFTGAELGQICRHALLKPMLERLVLLGEGIMGYADKQGKALRRHDGSLEPVKKNETLRIAHPCDLLAAKDWDKWQRECFQTERLQPFKQVFRELYVVTGQERSDKTLSRRYAGQQVNPRQASALWGQRGWKIDDGVFKVFHAEELMALVNFDYGITTPLEVEGLTFDDVRFVNHEHELLNLKDVPKRIFSEVMRDLDLVVSVAHRGGVDPEASASTVEMRSTLLDETCRLLGIKNVKLKKSHATIKGQLGEYSVHLGSAVVHRLPGGSVCIVPVHAQHRGRLFLPFADDDPKTAEVISKVLLLSRDDEIQDPTILEQLRGIAV